MPTAAAADMDNQLSIDEALFRQLLCRLPVAKSGRLAVNLGKLGPAELLLDQVRLGRDTVELPLGIAGGMLGKGKLLHLQLSGWQFSAGVLWFTLEQLGPLRGRLLQACRAALSSLLIPQLSGQATKDPQLVRAGGRLGLPVEALLRRAGAAGLGLEVTAITVDRGIVIRFRGSEQEPGHAGLNGRKSARRNRARAQSVPPG